MIFVPFVMIMFLLVFIVFFIKELVIGYKVGIVGYFTITFVKVRILLRYIGKKLYLCTLFRGDCTQRYFSSLFSPMRHR